MKNYLAFLALFVGLVFLFMVLINNGGIQKSSRKLSVLDTLQGHWVNESDSMNQIFISGRNWNEKYFSPEFSIDYRLRIYFSDTIVKGVDFRLVKIDTTLLSGNYILTVDLNDFSINCASINGITQNLAGTYFSISPTGSGTLHCIDFRKIK